MDFNIFLSNINSIDKYIDNIPSKFTNDIVPGIQLNTSSDWEVALNSLILPFQGFNSKFLIDRKLYQIAWVITENGRNQTFKTTHKVTVAISDIFESNPEQIFKKFIRESEITTGKSFFNYILNVYNGFLIVTGRYDTAPKDNGAFKNIVSIVLILNDNTQNLFGLDSQAYNLYTVNSNARNLKKQFTGGKKIGLEVTPSPHIKIYSDIIKPVNFGNQNLQILDILPFGQSKNHERKINELCYRKVNTSDIKNISIIIHDSGNRILENYTEHVILSLHFRKRT